ncbi:MAG: hypothetical protein J6U30_01415, partial [Oscillospiraceae bacterium]|nr:hypothetical protein [Oscillospiraceae bacterium]
YIKERKGVQILDYGKAQFNFRAPDAKTVTVKGWGGSLPQEFELTKEEDSDYFSCVADGILPGFHYCDFFVDGVRTVNDLAPIGYGDFRIANYFEMPCEDSEFWMLQDVPHGDVNFEIYPSSVTGKMKAAFVYTPPKYDEEPGERYPVFYVQHGGGESEPAWVWLGKINYIADNLIAQGRIRKMIIVMTTGYAFEEGKKYAMIPGDIHKEIAEDLVPFIDKRYRTIPEKDSRAIAGLSLGSAVAWKTGLEYRKTVFSYLGMFSGGLSRDGRRGSFDSGDIFDKGDEFNSDIKVLYAAWGSEEPVGKTNMEFIEEVAKNGIDVKHDTYFGWHEWDVWRHAAASFMQLIFR